MTPDDLSFSVLAGVSSRFEGVVTVLTTTKEELGKVEELLPTLKVFEQRHGLLGEQDSGGSGSAVAYSDKGGNFAGKGKGGPERLLWLATSVMLEPGSRAIKFGNKGFLEVAGVGSVELRCETPKGEQVNLFREVAYVPGVAENLFSVKKATSVGAEVVFRGKVCEVSMDGEVVFRAEENAEGNARCLSTEDNVGRYLLAREGS
ncbi:hypothetical protein KFL_007630035 [Klebsormidium nitens]|uniref:Retrovirus-related Pol polyprotein from transposon TNT 1-94-like beta-barrel domain-containing protein n=1 Tax=Klebsormidium nitens TaxID=105231 RepID=A0A1Y1IKU6_KLENI|nr:hypothetical protein KFL_007630035 [Klebsormidium nitens]|eukprot:GAQ91313.1 hypothetical protein KFL_007630035 [Klebsormidium nitens]